MGGSLQALVTDERPRVLSGFAQGSTPKVETEDHMVTAGFELSCRSCGGGRFRAFEVSTGWAGNDGAAQESVTGLTVVCAACDDGVELFDAVRDGYDGELGHLKFMDGPRSQSPLRKEAAELGEIELRVWFTFNSELSELEQVGVETGVRPIDLFDWFAVEARSSLDAAWDWVWDHECA
jgi:hypothetical protein